MRCASKQCVNNYQIHSLAINAVLMRFESKKSIDLILKLGCPILRHVLFPNNNKAYQHGDDPTASTISCPHDVVVYIISYGPCREKTSLRFERVRPTPV